MVINKYLDGLKKAGKKAVSTALIVGTLATPALSEQPHLAEKQTVVEDYAVEHVEESKEEKFMDVYHFLTEGEEAGDRYTQERFENFYNNLADKHFGEYGEESLEKFNSEVDRLVPKIGDAVYGDRDGEVSLTEFNKLEEKFEGNKAYKEIKNRLDL